MKPTQQEIIELAREHATRYTNRHYPDKPVFTFTQDALQKVIELALERFGAGGGEPLTDDQKDELWYRAYRDESRRAAFVWYFKGIADAERAHGIGIPATSPTGAAAASWLSGAINSPVQSPPGRGNVLPVQRVMLIDEEIEDLARGKSGHSDFARAVMQEKQS